MATLKTTKKEEHGTIKPPFFAHSSITLTTSASYLPHYLSNYHRFHLYYLR